MASSNETVYTKHSYQYIAPESPNSLVESAAFVINFPERKFIYVGLDPTDKFKTVIHIVTNSRHICINSDYLKRIYSLMGYILSVILDTPIKRREIIFFNDEVMTLSKTTYRGKNMLVLNSEVQNGCRVLLNIDDLLTLQYMEWSINETVVKKSTIIRPMVMEQFKQISNYFKNILSINNNKDWKPAELARFVSNTNDQIIIDNIPRSNQCFVSQIKLFAVDQLVRDISAEMFKVFIILIIINRQEFNLFF